MNNTFSPSEHLITIKNRQSSSEYLPVQWRLVWFRQECPEGTIETEIVHLDLDREVEEEVFVWNSEKGYSEKVVKAGKGLAIMRAVVKDGKGGMATGTKMEKAASFPDFLEKAETGAIGRALAALGYGTQFAPELDEQHRIVDSPVDRRQISAHSNGSMASNGRTAETAHKGPGNETEATEQQVASIRKLCAHLGKAEPENITTITSLAAKKLIQQLTAEYRESRQNSKAS